MLSVFKHAHVEVEVSYIAVVFSVNVYHVCFLFTSHLHIEQKKQAEFGSVAMVAAATKIFSSDDVLPSFPPIYGTLPWPDPLSDLWL